MKPTTITVYLAEDGREFRNAARCEAYERNCAAVASVMRVIGPRYGGIDYAIGGGYVQRPLNGDAVFALIRALPDAPHPRDCDAPWDRAYQRATCIDMAGREWGQPYFALNPGKGTLREITP